MLHKAFSLEPGAQPITAQLSPTPASAASAPRLVAIAAQIADQCAAHAADVDHCGAFPQADFQRLATAGLLTAPLRPALGGCGLGVEAGTLHELLLLLLKHVGRGNLAVGRVYEGHVNALQLIQTFGTPEQIERYGQDARHHKVFGIWNAEDAQGVKIVPLGSGCYRLEGAKT
ncbi:MAG: acyl-CoA dehydrogenase family protein, partial [Elainellaceae cyanobacterium]